MITKDVIIEMFDGMAAEPSLDTHDQLLWGYFFTATSKDKLERVAPLLSAHGYTVVDICQSDKGVPGEPDLW